MANNIKKKYRIHIPLSMSDRVNGWHEQTSSADKQKVEKKWRKNCYNYN